MAAGVDMTVSIMVVVANAVGAGMAKEEDLFPILRHFQRECSCLHSKQVLVDYKNYRQRNMKDEIYLSFFHSMTKTG
jgi:hypothetical protein